MPSTVLAAQPPVCGLRRSGRSTAVTLAAAALLSSAACDSPLSPQDLAGTYVYAPVGGVQFDYPADGVPDVYTLEIHDTLTLRADGTGRLSGVSTWITPPPDALPVGPRTVILSYTIDHRIVRTRVAVPVECQIAAFCESQYRISGNQLILDNGSAPEYRGVYVRVGPPAL